MPVCCESSGQASTEVSSYQYEGARVVCTEVRVATNDEVRSSSTARPNYTAKQLMQLPRDERRRILELAAADARPDYVNNKDLTDFPAFDSKDLYDETS